MYSSRDVRVVSGILMADKLTPIPSVCIRNQRHPWIKTGNHACVIPHVVQRGDAEIRHAESGDRCSCSCLPNSTMNSHRPHAHLSNVNGCKIHTIYKHSKSSLSAILALRPSYTPGQTIMLSLSARSSRSRETADFGDFLGRSILVVFVERPSRRVFSSTFICSIS